MSNDMLGVKDIGGVVADLLEKLGGPNGPEWLVAMKRFLRKENPLQMGPFVRDMTKEGWELVKDVPQSLSAAGSLEFVSFLKSGESYISGTEMRKRAKSMGASYGQSDAEWLLENQRLIPESERGHYLVFPGTIWRDRCGCLFVPCLRWYSDHWCLRFTWLEYDWNSDDRLVWPRK